MSTFHYTYGKLHDHVTISRAVWSADGHADCVQTFPHVHTQTIFLSVLYHTKTFYLT